MQSERCAKWPCWWRAGSRFALDGGGALTLVTTLRAEFPLA